MARRGGFAATFNGVRYLLFALGGLEAARAVLGHTGGGCITDVYTFDAVADEMVRTASPAVEALG